MISLENYEEYMILHADGELQPAEEQELMAFLDIYPEMKNEMIAYGLTHLSPDENIIYAEKESLLKKEPKRTIIFPQWRKYAIAAGIAALICISFFTYRAINSDTVEIARVDTAKASLPASKNYRQQQIQPKPQQAPQSIVVAPALAHPGKVTPARHHDLPAVTTHKKQAVNAKQKDDALVNNSTSAINHGTEISSLSTTNTKQLPSEIAHVSPHTIAVPACEIAITDKPAKRSFIDRLPIDEANKRQLKTIAHIASSASRSVNKVKEELDGNAITLNINNNSVHISL